MMEELSDEGFVLQEQVMTIAKTVMTFLTTEGDSCYEMND
jgi:hypothetical protein